MFKTNLLTIATTNTLEAGPGQLLITANKKGKDLAPTERYRSIIIPEWDLSALCTDKIRGILFDKLMELAREQLATLRDAGTVQPEAFTVNGLLSYAQEQGTSQRITNEAILIWFKATQTAAKIRAKRNDETCMKYAALYAKCSSPNPGFSKQEATILIGNMEPEDAETRIGTFIIERLDKVLNKKEEFSMELL